MTNPRIRLAFYAGLLLPLAFPAALRAQDEPEKTGLLREFRLQQEFHPIGYVVPEKEFRFTNFIPMHPAGFRASEYSMYFAPTYGLGDGWEVTAGVTGAERQGAGGNALFYGGGLQKQFVTEKSGRPAVSVGGYGMFGPKDHRSGNLYLAASKEMWRRGPRAVFLHGGAKYELYDGQDFGSGSGVRPFVGLTVPVSRRVTLGAEYSPDQPFEDTNMYSAGVTVLIYRGFGVSGGIQNNGFETHGFISIVLGRLR